MGNQRIAAHVVTSISDFTSFLAENFQEMDDILFRGQHQDWPLLPKISRLSFREGSDLLSAERTMLDDLKRQASSLIDFVPENDWDWLSVAQHYGMATRLLDWTTNPLAALWFAIEKPAANRSPTTTPKESAVVWTFSPQRADYVSNSLRESPFSGNRTKVFRPRHIASRIRAQAGWFTVHKYIADKEKFIPLEKQKQYKSALMKIIIPHDKFSSLRYDLDRFGLNAASMLTDLGGLCRHIEWQNSLLEDEMD